MTALAVAANVQSGTATRSPAPTPIPRSASSIAVVPLTVATACARPESAAMRRSIWVTKGPADETQLSRTHSARYFASLPRRSGIVTGINVCSAIAALPCRLPAGPGGGQHGHQGGKLPRGLEVVGKPPPEN